MSNNVICATDPIAFDQLMLQYAESCYRATVQVSLTKQHTQYDISTDKLCLAHVGDGVTIVLMCSYNNRIITDELLHGAHDAVVDWCKQRKWMPISAMPVLPTPLMEGNFHSIFRFKRKEAERNILELHRWDEHSSEFDVCVLEEGI